MSNVHTLRDLESQNKRANSQPLPDAWKTFPMRYERLEAPEPREMNKRVQFAYMGIDGNKVTVEQDQMPNPMQLLCLSCCPCFVGPICSSDKQKQYLSAIKSFCFIISVIQLLMLIVALGIGGFASPSINPSLGPPSEALIILGAKVTKLIQQGQVWRLVMPIFLHAGFIHLFLNVYAQLRFGMSLERKYGLLRFLIVYFLSGIGGSILSCLIRPDAVGVGASGAIMGLMGCFVTEILYTWSITDPRTRRFNLIQSLVVIGFIMLLSLAPMVDLGAHLGGLFVGMIVGMAFFAQQAESHLVRKYSIYACIGFLTVYFVGGLLILYFVL